MSKIEIQTKGCGSGKYSIFACLGVKIVGSVFVDNSDHENNFGPLQVNPPYRKLGIATQLMTQAEKLIQGDPTAPFCPDPGMEREAERFYRDRGFEIVDGKVVKKR
jgi:GNAT superfamily N-acetyltransferase